MNTKHKRYKEYNRLNIKSTENSIAQRNLGWKELEEPIRDGYDIEYVLRADIARREDAHLYEYLLEHFSEKRWCRDKSFEKYNWRTRVKDEIVPFIKMIDEREYAKYIPSFQKLWVRSPKDDEYSYWYGDIKMYVCAIPEWYLKLKITKHYRTHYQVVDEVLIQEEAYLDDKMWSGEFKCFSGMNGGMKPYAKARNRSDRKYNKQTLKYNMTLQEAATYYDYCEDDYRVCDEDWHDWMNYDINGKEFRYAHKHSAKWDRW